jgi:hypothetical protein
MSPSPGEHEGVCHCRAIGFVYRTALPPRDWPIRACQCSFCRTHAALSTSDPAGSLEFREHSPGALHRYRFGRRTADFLVCRICGVYIGAVLQSGTRSFGIINVRVLTSLLEQLPDASPMSYDGEEAAERVARREKRWTPAAFANPADDPNRLTDGTAT